MRPLLFDEAAAAQAAAAQAQAPAPGEGSTDMELESGKIQNTKETASLSGKSTKNTSEHSDK